MATTRKVRAPVFAQRAARRSGAARSAYKLEAEAIKAVAHPKRLLLMDLLGDGTERTVTELVELTGISQSNVSQNLATLRSAGLVAVRREGRLAYYSVRDERILEAMRLMGDALAEISTDARFLRERAALKRKAATRRASRAGATAFVALVALGLLASIHPLVVGGSVADVADHVQLMGGSDGLGGLVERCMSASPDDPAGSRAGADPMSMRGGTGP